MNDGWICDACGAAASGDMCESCGSGRPLSTPDIPVKGSFGHLYGIPSDSRSKPARWIAITLVIVVVGGFVLIWLR